MRNEWWDLAEKTAREMNASDPEAATALIMEYIHVDKLIDSVCLSMRCGVPPPPGHTKCVDYIRHKRRYKKNAYKRWSEGQVKDWMDETFPCDRVIEGAREVFVGAIKAHWHVFCDHDLYEDMLYIKDHIGLVPPTIQEKWKWEFVATFGQDKEFSQFTSPEASWLRRKMGGYIATAKPSGPPPRRKPKRVKH